jgi:colanic acid/amylovoran biosynthesis protein
MIYGKKLVEVKGIGFPNRGAELLLCACLQKLDEKGFLVCTEPYNSYRYKMRYSLLTKTKIHKNGINLLWMFSLLPFYVRDRLGLVIEKEVDFILDASGYAYGDPWSGSLADSRILNEIKSKKIVLLPQSFGPFTKKDSTRVIMKISKEAHAIFARESIGADFIQSVTGRNVPVVPDITFGLNLSKVNEAKRDIIIIPNFQVYDREGEGYIGLLSKLIENLSDSGRTITLLNHEGSKDLLLCERIIKDFKGKVDIELCLPSSGLHAKEVISQARFVVSSRYHGLISALSQSVPCYPIGWSFKYIEAMKLFNIEVGSNIPSVEYLTELIFSRNYGEYFSSEEYKELLYEVKAKVESSWNEILVI